MWLHEPGLMLHRSSPLSIYCNIYLHRIRVSVKRVAVSKFLPLHFSIIYQFAKGLSRYSRDREFNTSLTVKIYDVKFLN